MLIEFEKATNLVLFQNYPEFGDDRGTAFKVERVLATNKSQASHPKITETAVIRIICISENSI